MTDPAVCECGHVWGEVRPVRLADGALWDVLYLPGDLLVFKLVTVCPACARRWYFNTRRVGLMENERVKE